MSVMRMARYTRCIQGLRHGRKIGMIIRQIIVKPDSTAGVNTSARSLVLTVTSAMVVVAHGIIRERSVQHGEGNTTNVDAKITSQKCVMQRIKCTL